MQEKRIPIEDFGAEYPHVAADYERRGIVAVWHLWGGKAKRPTMVHEHRGPRFVYVWGSRALYERWRASHQAKPVPVPAYHVEMGGAVRWYYTLAQAVCGARSFAHDTGAAVDVLDETGYPVVTVHNRGLDQAEAVDAMRAAMHAWDKLEKIARREYPGVAEQEIFRLVSRAFEHITGLDKVLGA